MAKKRAFASQHQSFRMNRLSRLGRSALLWSATLLSFSAIALMAADQMFRPDAFKVDKLEIEGKFLHLQPETVEQVVNKITLGNFFSIELNEIKQAVESIGWVQEAHVRRQWPDTLLISVIENVPVMRWNRSQWVNSYGEVISVADKVSLVEPIQLQGNDSDSKLMLEQAMIWKRQLQDIGLRLQQLSLSTSQSWELKLEDVADDYSFELMLGSDQLEQRFDRFKSIYVNQFKLAKLQLQRVDMRYPDGLAIKSTPMKKDKQLAHSN